MLRNKRHYHDEQGFSKAQDIVTESSFNKKLGDLLKDFPQLSDRTPLVNEYFLPQEFDKKAMIYVLEPNKTIQLTELKVKMEGYIYAMIVPKNDELNSKMINLHIKYGIDVNNQPSLWKKSWAIFNSSDLIY